MALGKYAVDYEKRVDYDRLRKESKPEIVSLLLSPLDVLSQSAVTVSPIIKAPPVPLPVLMDNLASVNVGAILSTVALVVSAVVVLLPALSFTVKDTFRLVVSIEPETIVYVAVQASLLLLAATEEPPPNCVKSTVTLAIVSLLLSPVAKVLSQVAVTVSPILYAPPEPVAPEIVILSSVAVGAVLSKVKLDVSAVVVVLPALSVAVTEALRLLVSMEPETTV